MRTLVISMRERSPENDIEFMDETEMMTKGGLRLSPGSMYSLLESMVQEQIIKEREDSKYELTQNTKEEFGWPYGSHGARPRTVEDMLRKIEDYASYFEDLAKSDKVRIEALADRLAALA